MPDFRGKYWSFTLNNYTDEDVARLSEPITDVDYIIFGREVGDSGTPHLQGTVCFSVRKRLNQLIALLGQVHFSLTRQLNESIEYCKKDGNYSEFGVRPQTETNRRRRRSDNENGDEQRVEDFKTAVKEGMLSLEELRENHSLFCAKHPRFVKEYVDDKRPKVQVIRNFSNKFNNRTKTTNATSFAHSLIHRWTPFHFDHGKLHYIRD